MHHFHKYLNDRTTTYFTLTFLALSMSASAATSSTSELTASAPVSSTSLNTGWATEFSKKLSFKYSATFHGPRVADPSSKFAPNNEGKASTKEWDKLNFDGDITAGYRVQKDTVIGPIVPFKLVPVAGQHFVIGDVGIRAVDKNTFRSGEFALDTNFTVQVPTSRYSSTTGMDFALKTAPVVRYHLAGTGWNFGAITEGKAYFGVQQKSKDFKVWLAPSVSYALSDKLSLKLMLDWELNHYSGNPALQFKTYQQDLQPGVVWNVTPKLMVNPYLMVFTNERIDWDAVAFGTYFSATLL